MNCFGALYQTAQRQCLCPSKFAYRIQPCLAQFPRATASVPADQPHDPLLFPSMSPVVDRLMAHTALFTNRRRMFAFAQHQQPRCPQPCIPPRMIDRQLEQGFVFAGTQVQSDFHVALSGGCLWTSKANFNPVITNYL